MDADLGKTFDHAGAEPPTSRTSRCDVPPCFAGMGQAADIKPSTFLTTTTEEPKRSSMIMRHRRFCGGRSAAPTALAPRVNGIAVLTGVRAPRRDFPHSCFSLSRNRCQPVSRASLLIVILLVRVISIVRSWEPGGTLAQAVQCLNLRGE